MATIPGDQAATHPAPVYGASILSSMLSPERQTDENVVSLWLARFESGHTKAAYLQAFRRLVEHVGGLRAITLDRLLAFAKTVTGKPATRAATFAAIKSLLTFATEIGYIPFNVGKGLALPRVKNTLSERILDEADVLRLIDTPGPGSRDNVLLRILYTTGARVSEIATLRWRDVRPRDEDRGQVCLYGKGGQTRVVIVENSGTWSMLLALRGDASDDDPVFVSRTGGGSLTSRGVWRLVRRCAMRAGITCPVSPHWLRHAHASHALDNGATIAEVQATLGHSSIATTSRYVHARPNSSSGRVLKV